VSRFAFVNFVFLMMRDADSPSFRLRKWFPRLPRITPRTRSCYFNREAALFFDGSVPFHLVPAAVNTFSFPQVLGG